MQKHSTRKAKIDWKKVTVSSIALILAVVLVAGLVSMVVSAAETDAVNITVTDGQNPVSGATVEVEQVFDPTWINQNSLKVERLGNITRSADNGIQSGAIYGRYYVQVGKGNPSTGIVWFYIWDLETQTQIASIPMTGDGGAYKNNNANFGTEFYDENDKLPLLYVSSAYDIRIAVIRIYEEEGQWKAKQVQIIDYHEDFSNENGFYSCNLMLDNANGFLWLTPIDNVYDEGNVTKQMFFKFKMPKFVENSVVKLDRSQSLQYWETSYEFAPQGGFLMDNVIYQVFGPNRGGILRTFDLTTGQWTSRILLANLGYTPEPEACAFSNGAIYSTCPSGSLWKITPTEYHESATTLLNSITLNKDADWEAGFLATPGTSGCVDGQEHSQSGNKIYRTDLIPVYGSEYINIPKPDHYKVDEGGYYKWKIYWYGTDAAKSGTAIDYVGVAAEQTDFSQTNKFQVPDGAAYVRICVASVLSSGTEQNFPEADFLNKGGLTVQMYRDESTVKSFSVNESLVLGFIAHKGSNAGQYSNASNYNKLASTNKAYSTNGAKLLYVTVPEHPTVANGDYYKWKVLFYKGDTFLGMASEIGDLENHPVFDIPAEADCFKVSMASMVNGAAATLFPLSDFIADGGMTITLTGISEEVEDLPWMEKVSATTDATGKVSVNVPDNIVVRYTVKADGYKAVTGTATAAQYANGLTVALQAAATPNLHITVTDGTNPLPGATVTIEQTSDATVEEEETVAELLKTITLNNTSDWTKGFLESKNRPYGLNKGQEHTNSGNKIYRTGLIPVEGSEYITVTAPSHYKAGAGGYYKWRIHWYGTNAETGATTAETIDFIDYANEQTDLSQHTRFAVPEGACYVRIAVASVLSTGTEQTFPLTTFCEVDSGLVIGLYRNESNFVDVRINSTGVLEVGSIDVTTGAFVENALHARTNAPFSTTDASMLAVNFPSTSGVSYKWRVLFYNNNNFVSASAEQTEMDTQVYFDVPSGANEYKIVFTSVVSNTETAVNLPTFCQNGGINVKLYGATTVAKQEWITNSGVTDANGKISFIVPEGANYKYTVSAHGYVTKTATLTPTDYANTVNVKLAEEIDYSDTLDITVNNGSTVIPGATVKVEQIFDSSLMRQDTVTLEKVGGFSNKGGGCQGGGIYDHYYVQVEKGSGSPLKVWFHIFDLETNKQIATVAMTGDGGAYKNNNANFGTEFYDKNDPFPLLYVSSAYDARTVAVRIYQDGEEWKAEQVQVIDYSEHMNNDDGFYSCNVLLDNENGFMYLTPINATYTDTVNCTKQWFYKFNMPKLSDGYEVIITPEMALEERIETAYEFAPQGGCLLNGKVYQTFGYGSGSRPGKVCIFDLATGEYEAKIDVTALGCSGEPESGGFYNGSFYFITVGGGVYKLTPNAYLPEEKTENTDTLLNTITLNKDADWEVGFLATPSTTDSYIDGQETKQGNKIYRSGLIDVSGTDYIYVNAPTHETSGYAYKWKIYWYGENAKVGATTEEDVDFVSCAAEQTDFSFDNKFLVPDGAKYVRICIASIKGTTLSASAQSTFPIDSFLSQTTNGMTVQFYEIPEGAEPEKNTLFLENESKITDENGKVSFEVVPGAAFKITVSAPGYCTLAKTVSALDYLNGTTVTLTAHNLTKTDAEGATCTEGGNTAYWTCGTCSKHFSDAEGKTEIAVDSWKTPANNHGLTKVERVEPTKTEDGNIEHWFCGVCNKFYADAAGTQEITEAETILTANPDSGDHAMLIPAALIALLSISGAALLISKKRYF